jgi:hypothetical protein
MATNSNATIEEFLDKVLYVRSVSYQRKVGDKVFSELVAILSTLVFQETSSFQVLRQKFLYLSHARYMPQPYLITLITPAEEQKL